MKDLKEKFESGDYILLTKYCVDAEIRDWKRQIEWVHLRPNEVDRKLIHKKHKDILDAYLNGEEIESRSPSSVRFVDIDNFIEMYAESFDYRIKENKMKVKDFNGCWCEATNENYESIIKLGFTLKCNGGKFKSNNNDLFHFVAKHKVFYQCSKDILLGKSSLYCNLKQIHLVNGEWEYVMQDEVKDYLEIEGYKFEKPDWWSEDCKLLFKDDKDYICGIVNDDGKKLAICWFSDEGQVLEQDGVSLYSYSRDYSLIPYREKPKWYEDESNFPCLCTADNGKTFYIANNKSEASHIYNPSNDDIDRLATKEEVLSLLISE